MSFVVSFCFCSFRFLSGRSVVIGHGGNDTVVKIIQLIEFTAKYHRSDSS